MTLCAMKLRTGLAMTSASAGVRVECGTKPPGQIADVRVSPDFMTCGRP
jgi:hypothetical protein